MRVYGHASVWKTQLGVGRATDSRHRYQQLKAWWAAYQAARQEATREALTRCWDAKREVVTSCRADAASDMVASMHAGSTTTAFCNLSV